MNIATPRYLGPAANGGDVYIGSQHDKKAEIISFRGNMMTFAAYRGSSSTDTETETEKENIGAVYRSHRASRRAPRPQATSTSISTEPKRYSVYLNLLILL